MSDPLSPIAVDLVNRLNPASLAEIIRFLSTEDAIESLQNSDLRNIRLQIATKGVSHKKKKYFAGEETLGVHTAGLLGLVKYTQCNLPLLLDYLQDTLTSKTSQPSNSDQV